MTRTFIKLTGLGLVLLLAVSCGEKLTKKPESTEEVRRIAAKGPAEKNDNTFKMVEGDQMSLVWEFKDSHTVGTWDIYSSQAPNDIVDAVLIDKDLSTELTKLTLDQELFVNSAHGYIFAVLHSGGFSNLYFIDQKIGGTE